MTIKNVLRAIGTILVMPVCILSFVIGWPLYVLFGAPAVYGYDESADDAAMLSSLAAYQQQQEQLLLLEDQKSTRETLEEETHLDYKS